MMIVTIAWISNESLLKRSVCRSTLLFRGFCVFLFVAFGTFNLAPGGRDGQQVGGEGWGAITGSQK